MAIHLSFLGGESPFTTCWWGGDAFDPPAPPHILGRTMRLAKFLATAGVASRRASEEIIRLGRVTVNGQPVTDPARDVDGEADVQVDGQPLSVPEERAVYMVNKPTGVVSTARD